MPIEVLESSVRYQAKTKLLELAVELAETGSWRKKQPEINQGFKIFTRLQALDYGDYLTKDERDQICYCLMELADITDLPVAPVLGNVTPPAIVVGIKGDTGDTGAEGPEGGGVPFSYNSITSDTIVDSFSINTARGVDYSINIYGTNSSSTASMRTMRILGGWSSDGSSYNDDGGEGNDIYGDTSNVSISIVVSGSTVQLFAAVIGGTWTIEGTRKYIPNNGNGIVTPTTLTNGYVWVGNASNQPVAVSLSGDISITNAGVASITANSIVNADINSSAAIAVSKLATMTASKAVVTDGSGFLTTSTATATEVGYLSGVTSNIQTQLDSKLSAATGAISTVVNTDLTTNRAVISNGLGKIAVSAVTSTELGYLSGTTSSVQTQINTINTTLSSKVNSVGVTLYEKVVQIGSWNMHIAGGGSDNKSVAHGLSDYKKIRAMDVIIRNDADTTYYPLSNTNLSNSVDATNINLNQVIAGTSMFSFATFSGSSNRGWITITYEA